MCEFLQVKTIYGGFRWLLLPHIVKMLLSLSIPRYRLQMIHMHVWWRLIFSEQFSNAGDGNTEYIRAVESFMDICLNKKLVIAAIDATAIDNKQSNTWHILEI